MSHTNQASNKVRVGNEEISIDAMMLNMPMKISDATNSLLCNVSANERPFDAEVMRRNNKIVEGWKKDVLLHIADNNGCVPAGRVTSCFNIYLEGLEATQRQKYKNMMLEYPEEKVRFWIEFLHSKPIGELHEAGIGIVSGAWALITNAIRYHFIDKKWEVVYSQTTKPHEWDSLANDNPHLMNGRPLPFGLSLTILEEIQTKVRAICTHLIEPKK